MTSALLKDKAPFLLHETFDIGITVRTAVGKISSLNNERAVMRI
jgi:hypothetical protein